MWDRQKTGRHLLGGVAVLTAVGPYLADWNRTHLFNPRWTPHSRFHDAQSMLLGTFLGIGSLCFLYRGRRAERGQELALAAGLPALYWLAQGGSFLFPGARGLGSEFPELVPEIGGVRMDERFSSAGMLMAIGLGYRLTSSNR